MEANLFYASYTMSNKDALVSPQYKFAHTVSVVNYIYLVPNSMQNNMICLK